MNSNVRPLISTREALLPNEEAARARFRSACHRLGLSQFALALARACGCDESTVRRWYRGDVRAPACALVAAERLADQAARAACSLTPGEPRAPLFLALRLTVKLLSSDIPWRE